MKISDRLRPYLIPFVLIFGLIIGLLLPFNWLRENSADLLGKIVPVGHEADDHGHEDDSAADDHEDHVEISHTVQAAIGLRIGAVKLGDYQSQIEIPGFVREIPGATDLHIASRFEGVIKKVFISQSQTVSANQPICMIELTGEQLATAQSELLQAITQNDIIQSEIDRLRPLIQQGGVAGKRVIELQYEQNLAKATIQTKSQELLVRGFNEEQITQIKESRQLLKEIEIRVPRGLIPPQANAGQINFAKHQRYVVEEIFAKPGTLAQKGEDLVSVAFHDYLVVEGQAYEKDLPALYALMRNDSPIGVSIGTEFQFTDLPNQKIAYIANHADERTNTFPFFVYVKNQVEDKFTSTDETKNDNVSWRWKPGQRSHIQIPNEEFKDKIILPRDAVAIDGIRNMVFFWEEDHHDHSPDEVMDDHEHYDIYEPVDVQVLFMDREFVVVEPGEQLQPGAVIAMSKASQILFALQSGSGAGGHTHSHDH